MFVVSFLVLSWHPILLDGVSLEDVLNSLLIMVGTGFVGQFLFDLLVVSLELQHRA